MNYSISNTTEFGEYLTNPASLKKRADRVPPG